MRLNRPEALNALNEPLLRALLGSVDAARRDPAVRCLLVGGAGRAFCAGGDLKAMLAMKDREEFRAYIQLFQQLSGEMRRVGKPSVAAVHGYALAGGCGLAAACDLVIAADDAVFGLPEIKLGLLPLIVLAPILRAASPRRVLELVLSGRELPATEGLAMGLVTRVVPRVDLARVVDETARALAGFSPAALALGKEAFYRALELPYAPALGQLRDLLTIVARSEDAREGIAAFLEKRPPRWHGR